MASRALFRRKRFFTDYINSSHRPLQSFQVLARENAFQSLESRSYHPSVECPSTNENSINARAPAPDGISLATDKVQLSSGMEHFWWKGYYRNNILAAGNVRSELTSPLGFRWMSQSVRNASTAAAAKHQEVGTDDENNEELVSKKKKEASPEECDQAVEGLSTAKAKAKAKKFQEQKVSNSILQRTWTTFLGMGPALKAVASMSKSDSLSILYNLFYT